MVASIDPSPLSERSLGLFKTLVEHFIEDGMPVGSRTLSKDSKLKLSPATIRNVMADLEEIGLLHSPHTSSGRVPTNKGYRFFIDTLLKVNDLDSTEVERIAQRLQPEANHATLMRSASSMLSDITQLAGVVMLPRISQTMLQHIEFIPMSGSQVLVILVVNDQDVQNKIIDTGKTYSASQLQQVSNYLNELFSGKDLKDVRASIVTELEKMKEEVNQLMQTAIEMAKIAFDTNNTKNEDDDLVFSGQTNLMDVTDLSNMEKLKKLFESFNQKRDILHLFEQSINADGIQIFIGEESGYDVFDSCSVVTAPYESNGQVMGVLGVIGPTRMHYERVIPVVDITAKILSVILSSRK